MTIRKNGFEYQYDDIDGSVLYVKNSSDLEMWFDKDEQLIKARWKDGYQQQYANGKIVSFGY